MINDPSIRLHTHLLPDPSKYVFVPCNVIVPGLQPSMRIILGENLVTAGI